jgi:uracil-DNA glycosylase
MIRPTGPCPTPLMIIFDHATAKDVEQGEILSGPAGPELRRMCKEAGLEFGMAYVTAVVKSFPPKGKLEAWLPEKKKDIDYFKHSLYEDKWISSEVREGFEFLLKEIEMVKPRVIVVMGALGLWFLTRKDGLKTYRGSILKYNDIVVIPTYSPSLIFSMWSQRVVAVQDLRRAAEALEGKNIEPPKYNFILQPDFQITIETLDKLIKQVNTEPTMLSVDVETRSGHMTCIGLAWSELDAICIPFVRAEKGSYPYWNEDAEALIIFKLYQLLTHTNCLTITQNGNYDFSYIYTAWHFIPNHYQDTMISAHCAFPTMQKSLDFLASLYASYYLQWKGEMRGTFKIQEKKDA